jgi:GntR family transcriptional regulator of arabinose operon
MPTKTTGRNTKHETLTRTLLEMASTLRPGDRFPSQVELMRRFQVSDRTVLRSLEDLRRAGWIVRRHGSGTYVADPEQRLPPPPPSSLPAASTTIAALALTFGSFYQHCVDLLSVQAEAAGLSLVCHHARHEASFEDALPLEALHPRGFVLFSYYLLPIALRLMERGHRTVIMGAPPADVYVEAPCIYSDQELSGWMACRHLLDLGHRRIAYVFTNTRYPLERTLRWKGHRRALQEAEQAGHPVHSVVYNNDEVASWRSDPAAAAVHLRRPGAPTGLVTWNDDEAVLMIRILQRAGLRVPEDVSILGSGALPVSEDSFPPLTTVDQHVESQIRAVMDLLSRPSAPPPTQSLIVMPTLVNRASCAPPRERISSSPSAGTSRNNKTG